MKIKKIKYGFYSILDKDGREIAVANSWSEARKLIKKHLTNRTNKIK